MNVDALYAGLEGGTNVHTRATIRSGCKRLRESSRSDDALASSLQRSFPFKQLERWGNSTPPWPTKLRDADLEVLAARQVARRARRPATAILARLRRTFRTTDRPWRPTALGKTRCEYCVLDNRCMAVGCACRPSQCLGKSVGFRCLPGVHACNKHGLRVNVDNGRGTEVTLKDGRTLRSAFDDVPGPRRKRRKLVVPSAVATTRRRRQLLRRAAMNVASVVAARGWTDWKLRDVLEALASDETIGAQAVLTTDVC